MYALCLMLLACHNEGSSNLFERQATTEGTACDHIVVWFDWRPCWCILYRIILWPLSWMLWLIDTTVDDTEVSKSVEYCALRYGKNGTPSKHRSDEHQQGAGSEFEMVSEAMIGKRETSLLLQILGWCLISRCVFRWWHQQGEILCIMQHVFLQTSWCTIVSESSPQWNNHSFWNQGWFPHNDLTWTYQCVGNHLDHYGLFKGW